MVVVVGWGLEEVGDDVEALGEGWEVVEEVGVGRRQPQIATHSVSNHLRRLLTEQVAICCNPPARHFLAPHPPYMGPALAGGVFWVLLMISDIF